MKFNELEQRLEAHFKEVRYADRNGRILVGPVPFPLDKHIHDLQEGEEDQDTLYYDGYEELLRQRYTFEPIISFHFDSFGPCSFSHGLAFLRTGKNQGYLVVWGDACLCIGQNCKWISGFGVHVVIVAALEYGNRKNLLKILLRDFIRENGVPFGRHLFGSLPSETDNKQEKIFSREEVKETYWEWMVKEGEQDPSLWCSQEECVLAHERYSNPMDRSLSAIRGFPSITSPDAVQEWLDARDEDGLAQTEAERRIYFERYFEMSYRLIRRAS